MPHSVSKATLYIRIAAAPLLLTVVVVWIGLPKLKDWHGPAYTLTNELYVPAAMFAKGQGFIRPPIDEVPGLRAFMYPVEGDAAWNPESLPEAYSNTDWDTYERYHRYLIYSMGIVWWLFGVSWGSAKVLALGLYLAAVLQVYALFKLLMNRGFAFAGAMMFAVSPAVTSNLFNIRDFSKAPFLIALITVLIYLIIKRRATRQYILAAALLGAIVGLGLGFRRDLLIAFPPVILLLLFSPLVGGGFQPLRRAAGVAVMTLAALVLAAPILGTFMDKGSLVAHDMIMGMATILDDFIGIERTSYERLPVKHDIYASAVADGLERRSAAHNENGLIVSVTSSDAAKTQYVVETFRLFPADMILRAYAACVKILHGAADAAFGWMPFGINAYGTFYAVVALVTVAMFSPRLAFVLMVLFLYFGGSTSLQFETRHAFHMVFVPIGCLLFPVYCLARLVLYRLSNRKEEGANDDAIISTKVRMAWAGSFSVAALALIFVPWGLALLWQAGAVAKLENKLEQASLIKIETRAIQHGNWTYFLPVEDFPAVLPRPEILLPYYEPLYLMAEFDSFKEYSPIHWLVASEFGRQDYSAFVRGCPMADVEGERIRYFINLPEASSEILNSWFDAVGFPTEHAAKFRGLYLVTNTEAIGINPAFSLADSAALRKRHQSMGLPLGGGRWFHEPKAGFPTIRDEMREVHQMISAGELLPARERLEAAMQSGLLRPELYLALADCYAREGNPEAQMETLFTAIQERPNDRAMLYRLEGALRDEGDPRRILVVWERAAELAPGNALLAARVQSAREIVISLPAAHEH